MLIADTDRLTSRLGVHAPCRAFSSCCLCILLFIVLALSNYTKTKDNVNHLSFIAAFCYVRWFVDFVNRQGTPPMLHNASFVRKNDAHCALTHVNSFYAFRLIQ